MQAIFQLESDARGIYCGALGFLQPGGRATFNVPIRSVTLQHGRAQCGIGSGITAQSTPQQEWDECRYKQQFLERASTHFSILETLRLQDGVFYQRAAHLQRMASAALHFGYPWEQAKVCAALEAVQQLPDCARGNFRVRLLLDPQGRAQTQVFALEPAPERVRLWLASGPLEQNHSEFVRYKTTRRSHYAAFMPADARVFDTLLWNTNDELTECTRGNIAVRVEGIWLTPPLSSGLLPGVERARLLAASKLQEGVISLADLPRAEAFAFVSSVRGWLDADLVTGPETNPHANLVSNPVPNLVASPAPGTGPDSAGNAPAAARDAQRPA